MASLNSNTKRLAAELIEVSTKLMLMHIKSAFTAYENHPTIFEDDLDLVSPKLKSVRGMIRQGMDYAEKFALKGLPDKNEHTGTEGEPIVLTWEK